MQDCPWGKRSASTKLAEKMGVKCYDKELLDRAAKDSGLCQELFEHHDEKPTNSFLYSLVMDTYSIGYPSAALAEMPINHKIFLAQFNSIKEIAKEGSCIIVGRCADYALAGNPNLLSVFIHGKMENKIRRIATKYNLTDAKAKDVIIKTDKKRSSYYNYYSNKKWGDATEYDFCIDSGYYGIDGTVDLLFHMVNMKEGKA